MIFIVVAVAIQAVLPLLGHAAVLRVLRWLAIPFVVLFVMMAVLTSLEGQPARAGARRGLGRDARLPRAGHLSWRPGLDRER